MVEDGPKIKLVQPSHQSFSNPLGSFSGKCVRTVQLSHWSSLNPLGRVSGRCVRAEH